MTSEKKPDSKLSRFPEYKDEYEVNQELLERAVNAQVAHMHTLHADRFSELSGFYPYLEYRLTDLLVSVTDDLIRYARYHDIEKDMRKSNNKEIYSISESVRASYFAKWILKLKPATWDMASSKENYTSSQVESTEYTENNEHIINFCNEQLALLMLSILMNVQYKDKDEVVEFNRFFHRIDLSTVYYSLRYRTYHQDSYTLLFYKIASVCDEMSFSE
ncbi:MAG: hypothetical protein GY928_39015 [Colwellia sp.]|nr:hypothetical protein [Colwellia sp.]